MEREIKIESTIPVQARVSMITLAKLSHYWEEEGYHMRAMSQLVAWSCDLLVEILRNNEVLKDDIDTLKKAYNMLEVRGLFQKSLKNRAIKKVHAAIGFEGLREDGIDPKKYAPDAYKKMHRGSKGEVFDNEVEESVEDAFQRKKLDYQKAEYEKRHGKKKDLSYLEEAYRKAAEVNEEERREAIADDIRRAKESGVIVGGFREGISDGELEEYRRKQDEERTRLENQPVDVSQVKIAHEVED